MKSTKTIRLEPGMTEALKELAPKGIPEHAVLLFLLDLGLDRAKKLPKRDFLTAVTAHRMKVAAEGAERRQRVIEEQQRAAMEATEGEG